MSTKSYGDPIILTVNAGVWYTNNVQMFSVSYVDLNVGTEINLTIVPNEFTPGVYTFVLPQFAIGEYNVNVKNPDIFITPYVQPLSVIAQTNTPTGITNKLDNILLDLTVKSDKTDIAQISNTLNAIALDTSFIRGMTAGRWVIQGSKMLFFAEDNVTLLGNYALTAF